MRDTSPTSKAVKKGVVNAASQSDGADGSAESQRPSQRRQDGLGGMSEGIALVSLDCRIIGVNHCVGAILGLDSGAVLGRKYCELAQDESNTCENCPLDQIRSTGKPIETQCGLYSEDRMVAFHPVCDQAGRLAAYVLRFVDMGEGRHAERCLTQSNRLAALGELAAGVAHNFGNLLMSVSATLELLYMRAAVEETINDLVEVIAGAQEQVMRGAEITQRLLSLAKSTPSVITAVNPKAVADNALALCATHPFAKQLRLVNEIADGSPLVRADTGQLEEVLLNLLLNALQASESGTIRIGVRDSRKEGRVEIYVSDEGAGIAPEDVGRVFDPFFSHRRDESPGTGLGLAYSLVLVSRMGGAISVKSKLGEGSTFTINLLLWADEEECLAA